MNPLRLTAENYRTFERLDLTLPDGCTAIVGPNGAGKSSIVQILDLALFAGRGELAPHLSDADTGDLLVSLEFEHAGDLYRVRRTYSGRGRGKTTLDFERANGSANMSGNIPTEYSDVWEPLTREKADETQRLIEQTLGLSRETFRASAYLAQGDGAAFTEAQPRDRKRILAEVLGLDVYDQLHERARADQRAAQDALARLDGETATLQAAVNGKADAEASLARAASVLTQAHGDVVRADEHLAKVTDEYQGAQAARAELDQARAEARAVEAGFLRLHEIQQEALHAAEQAETVEAELRRLHPLVEELDAVETVEADLRARCDRHAALVREHEAAVRERDLKVAQRSAIRGQASELNEKAMVLRGQATDLEAKGSGEAHCDRCLQTLGAEALASALASMRAEADDLDSAASDLDVSADAVAIPDVPDPPADGPPTAALHQAQAKLREGRDAATQIRVLQERLGGLRHKTQLAAGDSFQGDLARAEHQHTQAEAKIDALTAQAPTDETIALLKGRGISARAAVDTARAAQARATEEKARCAERLDRIHEAEQALAATAERRAELHTELDLLAALERAYGRDGIPALIVENAAIPAIEIEASRILAELGTPYRVELRTQAALKSGEGLRDTLDVVVLGEAGERPYETFSGGERSRLNVALRIALARLLAHRRGAESRVLILDEVEYLDEQGQEALARVLRGLLDDFDKVALVSHVPGLREAFDQTITVVKAGGRSMVEEYAPEPVAA